MEADCAEMKSQWEQRKPGFEVKEPAGQQLEGLRGPWEDLGGFS